MKVYLLRHGETEGNVKGSYSGITDTPLTELGKQQAVDAHLRFEDIKFDVVVSSPLSRALDTARVFTDTKILTNEGLKEMNFGLFEGMTYDEIQEKYPEEAKKWAGTTKGYTFPEGESLNSFYDRVIKVYQDIIENNQVENLLIVAHSGVIKSILAEEISEGFDHFWKFKIDNCKVAIVEYSDDYKYLTALNI